jgi:aspartate/tyrosine/aromatic aminotransferase
MFEAIQTAPADAILGLTATFNEDPNPGKVNMTVGVYKDSAGKTPILETVAGVEKKIAAAETTKSYLPIGGEPAFSAAVQGLVFGAGHEIVAANRASTIQSPGGTGGLRVAGDFIHRMFPEARVWVSDPTWANHPNIFAHAGIEVSTYPYFDAASNGLAFEEMLAALRQVPRGDVVLLHGCCHNPTGVDPTPSQWDQIAEVAEESGWLPLIDFAYQGLGNGLDEDGKGLLRMCRPGCELFVASSFSKNFGLYKERVGALTVVTPSEAAAKAVQSQLLICIRTSYSNPPAHGSAIVTAVLADPKLRGEWEAEVKEMRDRINTMRKLFVDTLERKGAKRDFSSIVRQRGMFSFTGLTKDQVDVLRERYSIYLVGSGRINVASLNEGNVDRVCEAILRVIQE